MTFCYLPTKKNERDIFGFLPAEMERFFNLLTGEETNISKDYWRPTLSLKESNESYILTADLPGLEKKDVNISLENNVLTLKGERSYVKTKEGEKYHWNERKYGYFERSFTLPQDIVSAEKITAEMNNGQLKLVIPKKEQSKPEQKKIEIQ